MIAPPSRIEVDGVVKKYDVIAVAHQPARPLDAVRLRQFLEPSRPTPPASPARALGSSPERLATWVAALPEGGRNRGLLRDLYEITDSGYFVVLVPGHLRDAPAPGIGGADVWQIRLSTK